MEATPPAGLGAHLFACWRQNRHIDIRLRFMLADDKAVLVPAHKVVLERAAYFRALLSGPLAASTATGEIVVRLDDPSITPDAVQACIAFLYIDRLDRSDIDCGDAASARNLVGTLACASVLLCPTLERACVEQLRGCVNAETVVLLLECAKRYYQQGLEAAAMHWLCMHVHSAPDALLHQVGCCSALRTRAP